MSSTPATADPPPPAAPRTQTPPPGLVVARWYYVDERRTHEVHAGIRPGPATEFVVKESAFHNEDPDEVMETTTPIPEAWEGRLQVLELENRLALSGSYWRYDIMQPGWSKLRAPPFAAMDMRPVRTETFAGRVSFYQFHKKGSPEVTLAGIPQQTERGIRYLLARASYAWPLAEDGDVRLLHARLPVSVATSVLAREHLLLRDAGYERLYGAPDIAHVHGREWRRELQHAFEEFLRRISEGSFGPAPKEARRERVVDDAYTDYLTNLTDPRLIALHARFLTPEEEEKALALGEVGIKRLIAEKRHGVASNHDNMLLTILEASLLARDGLRHAGDAGGARVDPEVAALVRRFAFYL